MEYRHLPYPVRIDQIITETEDRNLKTFRFVFLDPEHKAKFLLIGSAQTDAARVLNLISRHAYRAGNLPTAGYSGRIFIAQNKKWMCIPVAASGGVVLGCSFRLDSSLTSC